MPRALVPTSADLSVAQLLHLLDEAYERRSWHGTNLRGSIRGLTPPEALWRARPGARTIAQIVVHCGYWKYTVRRRLLREPRGSFPLKGSNWFDLPPVFDTAAWRDCQKLLDQQHRALRAAVADLRATDLNRPAGTGGLTFGGLVRGIAAHDLYHAGQIQVIKGLHRRA